MNSDLPPIEGQGKVRRVAFLAVFLLVLTATMTALALDFSVNHGRLSAVPLYDDCVYLLKSALLVENFREGRFAEGIPDEIHSPFSVLLAAGAYLVLGYEDFAPYAANGLIVFLYLLFLVQLWRAMPLSALTPLLLLFLCLPIVALAVLEFRPDIAWGILAGGMGVFLVTSRDIFRSWRKALLLGVLLAACLLTKPSTFALTALIFLGGTTAYFVIAWSGGRESRWMLLSARGALIALATAAVLTLPYFLQERGHIWEYFLVHSFGKHKELWRFEGSFWEQAAYYITGWGRLTNLGSAGVLLLLWAVLGLAVVLWRGRTEERFRAVFGVLLVFGVYLVNTIATAKSVFLGAAIYGAFLFFLAWLLTEIWRHFPKFHKGLVILWWASALLGFLLFQWPLYSRVDPELAAHYRTMHQEAYGEIQKAVKARQHQNVLILAPGPVIPEVLALWSVRDGAPLNMINGGYIGSKESLHTELELVEVVLSQDPGAWGSNDFLPVEQLLPSANKILEEDPAFIRLATFGTDEGGSLYLFGTVP